MYLVHLFGTGIFPTGAGAGIVDSITTAISDNITEILVVLGFMVGLALVLRLFRHSTKGKV
jgi:hypothetical protein